jgi:hypothetical protein
MLRLSRHRFEVFTAVKTQVEVFCVVTLCAVVHSEDGGRKTLRYFGILPQHYTASKPTRLRLIRSRHPVD